MEWADFAQHLLMTVTAVAGAVTTIAGAVKAVIELTSFLRKRRDNKKST